MNPTLRNKHDRAVYFVLRACIRVGWISFTTDEAARTMFEYVASSYTTDELLRLLVNIEG